MPGANANLAFVLADAARTIADLRAEGKVVAFHCAAAQSRTTAVGIACANLLGHPWEEARAAVEAALPRPG